MQPCSREINDMNSLLSPSSAHSSQIQSASFDPSAPHDDFLDQILSALPSSSWSADETTPLPPSGQAGFHPTASLFSDESAPVVASNLRQQIMMMPSFPRRSDSSQNDSVQALSNGFAAGSLRGGVASSQPHHFYNPLGAQDLGTHGAVVNQGPQAQPQANASTINSDTPAQTKPRVRARRGQATDPHSIAERLRRERIAERMKGLQELVPNANKTDKASMLDEIIDYVKFLQLQVKVLSMSRLGGAASGAPLVPEGGGASGSNANGKNKTASCDNDVGVTMTEHQVAKLMEEDMGSAMQYLQGKGLCLMPISLATAISTSTCHLRNPIDGEVPTSPNMSAMTVHSTTLVNGAAVDGGAASVSKQ